MGTPQERRSYNIHYEQDRLAEEGFLEASRRISLVENLRAEIAERVQMVNPFELQIASSQVTGKGYEHRGDLSNTFKKSEVVAEEEGRDPVAKRFALENAGYEAAKKEFASLPLYSTVALFSPAPSIPIEGYPGYSLMYFYHILPGKNPDTRTIKALSFINRFDNEEQAQIIKNIQGGGTVSPTEEGLLLSPTGVYGLSPDTESFRAIWKEVERVYKRKERDFTIPSVEVAEDYLLLGEMAWKQRHAKIQIMMESIAESIEYGVTEDSEDLQKRWRILLNLADEELLHADFSNRMVQPQILSPMANASDAIVLFDALGYLNKDVRETTTSCGTSGNIGGDNIFVSPLEKLINQAQISTATYEIKVESPLDKVLGQHEEFDGFECPNSKCHFKTKLPVGDKCPSCKLTKEDFAKKGNKVC